MEREPLAFVNLAAFTNRNEAKSLKLALECQWMEARVVDEGSWDGRLFWNRPTASIHVQVPEDCYVEARRYLHPDQMSQG